MVLSNEADITWSLAATGGAQAPLVPSPVEWLTNDNETPPGGATTVTSPAALTSALSSASPGDTIVCNPPGGAGTIAFWNFISGINIPSGSAGNPVTIVAALNKGVVISAGEDFAGARTPNNGFWTQSGLSADDISKNIWRSVGTFPGGAQTMSGYWIEFGQNHQLIRALTMANLRAPSGQNDGPGNYDVPMVHKDTDGRVYIRMEKPNAVKWSRDNKWSATTFTDFPTAIVGGKLDYPKSQNPNTYSIYLFRTSTNQGAFRFGGSSTGHHVRIGNGINSMGYHYTLNQGTDLEMGRGTHWGFFLGFRPPIHRVYCNRTRFSDGCKIHTWLWKFGAWHSGVRSVFLTWGRGQASDLYFKDCTIAHYHEIAAGAHDFQRMRMRNCTFTYTLDDGFQCRYDMSQVEVGYCYYHYSDWGGMGESGVDENDPVPGQWFVHHNIIDCRLEKTGGPRRQPHPKDVHTTHSPDGNAPYLIYNNLVMYGPDREEGFQQGVGFQHSPQSTTGGNCTLNGTALTHQVFNNIILLDFIEGTKRYDPVVTNPDAQYSDSDQTRSDHLGNSVSRYSAALSNELQDYNLYWRPSSMTEKGRHRFQRGAGDTTVTYTDLATWRASAEFEHSKLSGVRRPAYSPGFEGNSTNTKPVIPALDDKANPNSRWLYRPSPTAAVTTATASTSLNGRNWWSTPPTWGDDHFPWNDGEMTLQPSPYKGPLDPNGSTMPIGVQNP